MFEKRDQPLLPWREFLLRFARSAAFAFSLVLLALAIGVLGYHGFESLSWTDSFLNASMILGGMGPVDPMKTQAGKIFAGCYALFSGLAFVGLAGLLFLPVAHRLLHHFHYDAEDGS